MAKKKGSGRPKARGEKVKVDYVYMKGSDIKKIEKKHGNLTKALRDVVLPEC